MRFIKSKQFRIIPTFMNPMYCGFPRGMGGVGINWLGFILIIKESCHYND